MRQQDAFETLRKWIMSEPVIRQPQLDQQFKVKVDASGYAIGAVLIQKRQNRQKTSSCLFL